MNVPLVTFTALIVCFLGLAVNAVEYYEPAGARLDSGSGAKSLSGDCWQGELCKQRCLTSARKAQYVGSINGVPVCCPFCERSGLSISPWFCGCRHNGPDPEYHPTEEELKEVEEFKRSGAPATGIISIVMVTSIMISLLVK